MADPDRERIPIRLRPVYDELVSRTDAVCREHLNEEYAQLCRRLAAALCRRRPSPVTRGRVDIWACEIAYAAVHAALQELYIGWVPESAGESV